MIDRWMNVTCRCCEEVVRVFLIIGLLGVRRVLKSISETRPAEVESKYLKIMWMSLCEKLASPRVDINTLSKSDCNMLS